MKSQPSCSQLFWPKKNQRGGEELALGRRAIFGLLGRHAKWVFSLENLIHLIHLSRLNLGSLILYRKTVELKTELWIPAFKLIMYQFYSLKFLISCKNNCFLSHFCTPYIFWGNFCIRLYSLRCLHLYTQFGLFLLQEKAKVGDI